MPKLFVPTLGSVITLSAPWRFTLKKEGRNAKLLKVATSPFKTEDEKPPTLAELRRTYRTHQTYDQDSVVGRPLTDDEIWWERRSLRFFTDEEIEECARRTLIPAIYEYDSTVVSRRRVLASARKRTPEEIKTEVTRLRRERANAISYHSRYGEQSHVMANSPDQQLFTLPVDTVLRVDRVYIRGKSHDSRRFDSLTFWITACPQDKRCKGARFFASLADCNNISFEMGACQFLDCMPPDVGDEEEV